MIEAVLFDLDGTLLDIDLDRFFARYFTAIGDYAAPRYPGVDVLRAILAGTGVMRAPHPGVTNSEAFWADFRANTGIEPSDAWPVFDEFYRTVFPSLSNGFGPVRGARESIEVARRLGLKIAVATQPIFPARAIEHRIAWAGLDDVPFDLVTTYETMQACKPDPDFFLQVATTLGVDPASCLMVGDDREADMPAANVGMLTYYVGGDPDARANHRGTLAELPGLLERLA